MGVDRKAGESIQEVEEKVHTRTSISSAGFRQKNKDGSGYVRLYDRRGIVNGRGRWKVETSCLPL